METGSQRIESIRLELIRRSLGDSPDVGVEVVQSTGADVGDILQADGTQNGLAVSRQEELLLANVHGHLVG